jgi:hypothetical protein
MQLEVVEQVELVVIQMEQLVDAGGIGLSSSITGCSVSRGGGGGGGTAGSPGQTGGPATFGGGAGGNNTLAGTAGVANTGGGAGGGSNGSNGGTGGPGIVIIKQNQASPTYSIASGVWSLQCQYNFKKQGTWTPSAPYSVDFLVIAGGGGGGALLVIVLQQEVEELEDIVHLFLEEQKLQLKMEHSSIPITVGAGGAGGSNPGVGKPQGTPGHNSIFSTITSAGGGGGGFSPGVGANGGSGGGGSSAPGVGGTGNTPPVSPPQGNAGGNWKNLRNK